MSHKILVISYDSHSVTFSWGLLKHASDKRFYDLLGGLDYDSTIKNLLENDVMVT